MTPDSPTSRLKILFLPRWYPNRTDPMPGLFIQRHALAVAEIADVAVVFVKSLPELSARFELETLREDGVFTIRAYFRGKENFSAWYNGLYFLVAFLKAILLLRKSFGKPDILHVHVLTRLGALAWCYKMITGTPYLVTEHWSRYLPAVGTYSGFWRKLVTRFVVKHAEAVTTVTANLRDAMVSKGLRNPHYTVINNVADTRLFHPEEPKTIDPKRFVHISCFEDRSKNISGLLRAIFALMHKRRDFVCHLVGEGADLERMRAYARELGLPGETIQFDGLREGEALAETLRQARFLVLFSNYENMPVVINEAFASGIPVVSTRVGGISEHVDAQKGILVEAGDESGLALALSEMLDHSEAYDRQAIRQYAVKNFSKQAIAEQFGAIYTRMATKNTAR